MGDRNKRLHVLLHTNLKRAEFRWRDVADLYRLRWQIELLFKEWKSHANLHRFDTSKDPIAEGLVWASLLVAILKRYLCHAVQRNTGVELSTQRAASSARHFLDDILQALLPGRRVLAFALQAAATFLLGNARRAHPARDRRRGRLAAGLRPVGASD
jgi:IS4 transposase